jgi:methionyl-tRNA formyltransferase
MYMDKGMDTGDILLTETTPIFDDDNAETLFDRLSVIGANLLIKTVEGLESGSIVPIKQNEAEATYAPIIKKEMGEIDFSKSAEEIDCLVRGLYPWPATYFTLCGKRFKVHKASVSDLHHSEDAGIVLETKNKLTISCGKFSAVEIIELQPEGKGVMTAAQMLNGYRIEKGSKIG